MQRLPRAPSADSLHLAFACRNEQGGGAWQLLHVRCIHNLSLSVGMASKGGKARTRWVSALAGQRRRASWHGQPSASGGCGSRVTAKPGTQRMPAVQGYVTALPSRKLTHHSPAAEEARRHGQ